MKCDLLIVKRLGAAFVLVLTTLAVSEAQQTQVAESFEQLRVVVGRGDTVTLTLTNGQEIEGTIADISSSTLTVERVLRQVREDEVATIRQRRPDPLKNGALWGLAAGVGVGLIAAAMGVGADGGYVDQPGALAAVLIAAPLCSGLGAGVDALINREQVIYRRHAPSSARLAILLRISK